MPPIPPFCAPAGNHPACWPGRNRRVGVLRHDPPASPGVILCSESLLPIQSKTENHLTPSDEQHAHHHRCGQGKDPNSDHTASLLRGLRQHNPAHSSVAAEPNHQRPALQQGSWSRRQRLAALLQRQGSSCQDQMGCQAGLGRRDAIGGQDQEDIPSLHDQLPVPEPRSEALAKISSQSLRLPPPQRIPSHQLLRRSQQPQNRERHPDHRARQYQHSHQQVLIFKTSHLRTHRPTAPLQCSGLEKPVAAALQHHHKIPHHDGHHHPNTDYDKRDQIKEKATAGAAVAKQAKDDMLPRLKGGSKLQLRRNWRQRAAQESMGGLHRHRRLHEGHLLQVRRGVALQLRLLRLGLTEDPPPRAPLRSRLRGLLDLLHRKMGLAGGYRCGACSLHVSCCLLDCR
mmetsp:Transcript_12037/g.26782  ORF Transcript_12037/g.26782 Transcript_12037/m.26782 type:complete len:399 (+) Transcript_12037:463-1659(+)